MSEDVLLNLAINYLFQGFLVGIVFCYMIYCTVGYFKERKGNKA